MSLFKEGRYIAPGNIVEFMHGNQPQLAFVIEEQAGKVMLYTINKRETKMPAARVLPWIGPQYSPTATRQEMLDFLVSHQEKRGEIQAGLDTMEIWELAQGELEKAPLEWFAGLLWEKPETDQISALGRAMIAAKTHFKFQPPEFVIYTQDKVDLRLQQEAEEKSREKIMTAGQELFKNIWAARESGGKIRPDQIPDMSEEIADGLKSFLMDRVSGLNEEKSNKMWSALRKGLPDHPHLPLLLAQGWGIIPQHHNYLFDEADYCSDDSWSDKYTDEINRLTDAVETKAAAPCPLPMRSIDAATTKDIDDAFNLIKKDDGGYTLTIALARPCMDWDFGGELDQAVMKRGTSIYLPEGTSHMMPEALGIGALSLFAGELRPALITTFEIDQLGVVTSVSPHTGWVKITDNSTYIAVEQMLRDGSDDEMALAFELSEKLLELRIKNGAVVIRRPEPELSLDGWPEKTSVKISTKEDTARADQIISEFMILANSGLGKFAEDHGFPLLYRTQDIVLPSDLSGIVTEPHEIFQRVRQMVPPQMETVPKKHATLAVTGYSPITSPLRRYADFINMAQLCHYLMEEQPKWDSDELKALADTLQLRLQSVIKIQRFRPRYWKLLYLLQNKKQWQHAVIVDDSGPLTTLAMPEIQINVRVPRPMLGDKLYPGQMFQIRFNRIDPLTNELRVVEAMEE
ncbi:ribonuclease catalytic domain-containing protein [Maridesulfovibrio hydrothermalis]|uniref:Ribonuclease II n=1 Tax=Maridesulfovibrio hydrothermalis AM13 = DSM 14728 TaxID=1121451 RepID=L0RFV0_9BACT|nr:ribonuclease catalytic domain-containing protein [Maridesulfovibrio hydrothermalis]CCO25085.1 Ribonuclease II [Maridesulfovibrio hydrothermalis AM13 = DSM 14728]